MKYILGLFLLLSIVSCGNNDDSVNEFDQRQREIRDANSAYLDGVDCGSYVISDYNDVSRNCRTFIDRSDLLKCRDMLQDFIDKYPGIYCGGYDKEVGYQMIDEAELELLILKIESSLF